MEKYIKKAEILVEALPYINKFKGINVVVKYGGSALINVTIKKTIMKVIAIMKIVGFNPIIVHGGGPEINSMLNRLDIKSDFINGLRVTTEETMEVVEMVLAGKLNKLITTELCLQGVKAVGISGKDNMMLKVEKLKPNGDDIGLVGEVKEVDISLIQSLIDNDFIPIISPIGCDYEGNSYNVNADYAAVAIAGALNAEKLVFLTDVEGVRLDSEDKTSVMSNLTTSKIGEMINKGTISGGMIPKVECCIAGLEAGVSNVHIIDGRVPHCLILEIFTNEGIGTLIERG